MSRAIRLTHRQIDALSGDHGTKLSYGRGCRCQDCRNAHTDYARLLRTGSAEPTGRNVRVTERQIQAAGGDKYVARALARIVAGPNCCWIWTGSRSNGYGYIGVGGGKQVLVHRMMYEHFVGPVPAGLVTDHLCRVRHCVNPAHMEPVTIRENNMRGMHPLAVIHRSGKCIRGHDVSESWRRPDGRVACCRICQRDRLREQARERRGESHPANP